MFSKIAEHMTRVQMLRQAVLLYMNKLLEAYGDGSLFMTYILKGEADTEAKPSSSAADRVYVFIIPAHNDLPGVVIFSNRVIVQNIFRLDTHSRGTHEVERININSYPSSITDLEILFES